MDRIGFFITWSINSRLGNINGSLIFYFQTAAKLLYIFRVAFTQFRSITPTTYYSLPSIPLTLCTFAKSCFDHNILTKKTKKFTRILHATPNVTKRNTCACVHSKWLHCDKSHLFFAARRGSYAKVEQTEQTDERIDIVRCLLLPSQGKPPRVPEREGVKTRKRNLANNAILFYLDGKWWARSFFLGKILYIQCGSS